MPLGLAKVGAEELRGERMGLGGAAAVTGLGLQGAPISFWGDPKWVQYGKSRVSSRSAE